MTGQALLPPHIGYEFSTLTQAEQDEVRSWFHERQPRCPKCGQVKALGSVGCPGPGRVHAASSPPQATPANASYEERP